jgi:hypothetical protein
MVRTALNNFTKPWGPFVRGIVAREIMPTWERLWDDFVQEETRLTSETNVPPRLRDGGARERGDAQGGRVGAPPNFGEIHGGRGDVGVPSIGVPGSKIIKKI